MEQLWRDLAIETDSSGEISQRIIAAAQCELLDKGVLGFRILNIARAADCSISVIYRYFEDRSGLIIHALGEIYHKLQEDYFNEVFTAVQARESITPEFLISLVPNLDEIENSRNMRMWLMAVAMSTESEALRASIESTIAKQIPDWIRFFEVVDRKLEPGTQLDLRVYEIIMRMHLLYYNSLFGEFRLSDNYYKGYLTELLSLSRNLGRS